MLNNNRKILRQEPYMYVGIIALAANANGQISFQISSNFDFFLEKFSYRSTVNVANAIPTFDLQFMKDTIQLMNDLVPNEMFTGLMREISTAPDTRYIMGIAANWYRFPKPFCFEGKSNLIVNLRDTSGQANTVQIALDGWKNVYAY